MKKKLFVFVALLSLVLSTVTSVIEGENVKAQEESKEVVANEWKYDNWSSWNYFISDSRLSESPWAIARLFGANTLYTAEEKTYEREYLGLTCSSWFLFVCTNIDYEYRDRTRNRWYEEGYSKVSEDTWIMGSLYELEEHQESTLQGFEQKKVVDVEGYNKVVGYNKKTVTKYNSWSGWNNYQRSSKLSDSSDWIWGSKKYSTATYEREYLGSVCVKRGFLGICKSKQYKYRERSRSSYTEQVDDYSNPITQYVPTTYKYVDDYSKPIYSYGEYEYANSKLLISLKAIVEGVTNDGIYAEDVKINWTNNSSVYGVTYTATLNDNPINRNHKVTKDGIYFLKVTGTNQEEDSYTQEIMFAINRDANVAVVDYKDENNNVIYREFIKDGQKSNVETYIENGKMYIDLEKKNSVSSLAYSYNADTSTQYVHNKFMSNIENEQESDEIQRLFTAELTLTAGVAYVGVVLLFGTALYMTTADPQVFREMGVVIEDFLTSAEQLIVDVAEWVWEGLKTAWNWIVSLFVAETVVETIAYVDDFSKSQNLEKEGCNGWHDWKTLTAAIAKKFGVAAIELTKNAKGWKFKLGDLIVRIASSGGIRTNPYARFTNEKGAFDADGNLSNDKAKTHIDLDKDNMCNSYNAIIDIIAKILGV